MFFVPWLHCLFRGLVPSPPGSQGGFFLRIISLAHSVLPLSPKSTPPLLPPWVYFSRMVVAQRRPTVSEGPVAYPIFNPGPSLLIKGWSKQLLSARLLLVTSPLSARSLPPTPSSPFCQSSGVGGRSFLAFGLFFFRDDRFVLRALWAQTFFFPPAFQFWELDGTSCLFKTGLLCFP